MTLAHTKRDIAAALGVNAQTVSNWVRKGCPALQGDGPWDVEAIRQWTALTDKRHLNKKKVLPDGATDWGQMKKEYDARLQEVKYKLSEYELQIETGKWVAIEDVKENNTRLANEIRKHLEAIPSAHADTVLFLKDVGKAKDVLETIIEDVLVLLSRKGNE